RGIAGSRRASSLCHLVQAAANLSFPFYGISPPSAIHPGIFWLRKSTSSGAVSLASAGSSQVRSKRLVSVRSGGSPRRRSHDETTSCLGGCALRRGADLRSGRVGE